MSPLAISRPPVQIVGLIVIVARVCGIVGLVGAAVGPTVPESVAMLERMCDTVTHRGPDGEGVWVSDTARVGLGHRRLAVIDLSPAAAQPMVLDGSPTAVIAFNGEIYNFRELRTRLERRGCRFRSDSDTEVLLQSCRTLGVPDTLSSLRGMFAFAYIDESAQELWLARDRFGEKPLYYACWAGGLAFASELKALRTLDRFPTDLDPAAVEMLLRHSCVGGERCIYRVARKLLPGTALRIRLGEWIDENSISPHVYWDPLAVADQARSEPFHGSLDDAADRLDELLGASVVASTVSDVPVGAFLSGGIDSTSVVSQLVRRTDSTVNTFTIGFSAGSYSEADHARSVAKHLGTHHTELTVTAKDALSLVPCLADLYDEPFADSSQIPTHLVSRLARHDVTVALSGDGGDEFFGGYPRFWMAESAWRRVQSLPRPARALLAASLDRVSPERADTMARVFGRGRLRTMSGSFDERLSKAAAMLRAERLDDVYRLFVTAFAEGSPLREPVALGGVELPAGGADLSRLMLRETVSYLPDDILAKVDRAAMSVSLETRIPMLTPELFTFSHQLPDAFTVGDRAGKVVLRHLLTRHVPPRLWDRSKQGFGVPLGPWLRGPLRPWAEDLLSPAALGRHGLFDTALVERLWQDHTEGRRNWGSRLWNVLSFQAWHQRWATPT